MALYLAVFFGGAPIGSPILGWIGERFGARWTILLGGGVAVAGRLVVGDNLEEPVSDTANDTTDEGENLDASVLPAVPQPHSEVLHRRAARVLLLDPDGRVLMMRGFDPAEPGVRFWFTIGGGLDPGESPVDGALRELHEETGLRLAAQDLSGPVHHEDVEFGFGQYQITQSQEFYVAAAPHGWRPEPAALEQIEIDTVDSWSWWSRDQLLAQAAGEPHDGPGEPGEIVYPAVLPDLLDRLTAAASHPGDLGR